MSERLHEKLEILADAAKYDVSCSSSGSKRKNNNKGLGDALGSGICHTYTEDGRCVSLLKILLTNHCIFDCAYCVTRKSNDIKRAAFTVQEVVDLTMNFYRRNYIEGLFLSSGIFKNADYTMERLVSVAKKLRTENKFNGYIHLKTIPGASDELMHEAGLWADRLSVNIEIPTESGLKLLAPDKNIKDMIEPMTYLKKEIIRTKEESKIFKLKRVYYSGYVPISNDNRLPGLGSAVPVLRENRLYQTDWLMRFYGFNVQELLNDQYPNLDPEIDPKLSWALRNMHYFPVDVNTADLQLILRVPGIGVQSAQKIVGARRFNKLGWEHLKKIGIAINRAKYFITCNSPITDRKDYTEAKIRQFILNESRSKFHTHAGQQYNLFG